VLNQGPQGFVTSTNLQTANTTINSGNSLVKVGFGTLELGGTSSNSYQGNTFLNEGKLLLNKQDVGTNEQQILQWGGNATGNVRLRFNGVDATGLALNVTDEVQRITFSGTSGGTYRPTFGGVAATSEQTFQTGTSPAPGTLQAQLESIPALAGNVTVTGNVGGPFDITFNNLLTNRNIPNTTALGGLGFLTSTGRRRADAAAGAKSPEHDSGAGGRQPVDYGAQRRSVHAVVPEHAGAVEPEPDRVH
jgi:autotransporter-associated beta strand protein